jgi:hypothetical protein
LVARDAMFPQASTERSEFLLERVPYWSFGRLGDKPQYRLWYWISLANHRRAITPSAAQPLQIDYPNEYRRGYAVELIIGLRACAGAAGGSDGPDRYVKQVNQVPGQVPAEILGESPTWVTP